MGSWFIRRANVVNSAGGGGRLPAEYTELEYIQSSGTQWIDTGIKSIVNLKTEIVCQQTSLVSGFPTIVGAVENSTYYKVIFGYNSRYIK